MDIEAQDGMGMTALHHMARVDDGASARVLVKYCTFLLIIVHKNEM
mgnify:CR=1 FL=1